VRRTISSSSTTRMVSLPCAAATASDLFRLSPLRRRRDGKENFEGGALSRRAVHLQSPLVPTDNAITAARPKPRPVNLVVKNGSKIFEMVAWSGFLEGCTGPYGGICGEHARWDCEVM
jgi:hypothetical protein